MRLSPPSVKRMFLGELSETLMLNVNLVSFYPSSQLLCRLSQACTVVLQYPLLPIPKTMHIVALVLPRQPFIFGSTQWTLAAQCDKFPLNERASVPRSPCPLPPQGLEFSSSFSSASHFASIAHLPLFSRAHCRDGSLGVWLLLLLVLVRKLGTSLGGDFWPRAGPPFLMFVT